jgi:1-deoxy-D-xylulose-5-phosphate synthase
MAPSSAQELQQMLSDAVSLVDDGPIAIRYPKGAARQVDADDIGSGFTARTLRTGDGRLAILAVGKMVAASLTAAARLAERGVEATVWDVRCCSPLDEDMIRDAARHGRVITVEDGIGDGGVGSTMAAEIHAINPTCQVHVLGVPTKFIPHAKPDRVLAHIGLDADGIVRAWESH